VISSALRALLALAAQIGFPPTRPVADEPAAAVVSAGRGAPMPHADRSQVGVRRAVRPASVTADQRPLPRPAHRLRDAAPLSAWLAHGFTL